MSQEPKTIKKKPYQEVGHGTQECDLTITVLQGNEVTPPQLSTMVVTVLQVN